MTTADIAPLTTAARRALEHFNLAKRSGSPSALGAARAELLRLKTALELARTDVVLEHAMSKALRSPIRMTR